VSEMSVLIPKKVFAMEMVGSGEKLYEVCVFLKDVPEALAKATKVLSNLNANIKTGAIFDVPDYPGIRFWSTFVEISNVAKGIEGLVEELRKLDVVEDVRFAEPKPLPFEILHFPPLYVTTRALVWPIGNFWALWDAIEEILKPSGAAVLHYNTGKRVGERVTKTLMKIFGVEGMDLILAVRQAVQTTGWGLVEFRELDLKRHRGTIIIKECFEALAWREKPYKTCHWSRGYIAGVANVIFGIPMKAEEVKCLATGDEYCEFRVEQERP